MKILITGVNGQVGSALKKTLYENELISLSRADCDFTNIEEIRKILDDYLPDLIINPAAYTGVDQAEDESELAFKINSDAPRVIAERAKELNIPLIHFSTDYVFDGNNTHSYSESEVTKPLGIYGKSKLAGEEKIQEIGGKFYIFRTSWVYSNIGRNFFLTMKQLCSNSNIIKVVNDQIGVPTSASFIANQIKKIIPHLSSNNTGVYHLVPDNFCSWFDFAKHIIKNIDPHYDMKKLIPISSNDYPAKVKRPQRSVLNNNKVKKTFMLDFASWDEYFKRFIYDT